MGLFAFAVWLPKARASPQGHAAAALGACAVAHDAEHPAFPHLCGALRAELLFGRERDRDFGLGPFLSLSTASFERYGATAGASFLLPLSPTYPFIVSFSAGALSLNPGWEPLVEGWLFWGPASYNFHSAYAMASGLLFGVERSLGHERVTIVSLAGQLDMELLALPFIAVEQWIAGADE